MERVPVSSTNIASIGYDPSTQILEVEFLSGGIYQYFGVPDYIYESFLNAGSKGSFFHEQIRNVYAYVRIG
jgi:hypothetical protein